jgi:hypothetical protein
MPKRDDLAFIEDALAIDAEEALAAGSLGFYGRVFCQTSLPYQDPRPMPVWSRQAGQLTLSIQPAVGPQLPDMTEGERPQERAQRRRRLHPEQHLAHPQIGDAVRAGEHPDEANLVPSAGLVPVMRLARGGPGWNRW